MYGELSSDEQRFFKTELESRKNETKQKREKLIGSNSKTFNEDVDFSKVDNEKINSVTRSLKATNEDIGSSVPNETQEDMWN
ncbi:hypothetical protein OZX56_05150 [Lactobacillus sp. ESL0684]|uniref:hypothetical protein n=1 Tax=Lactobacillus sp. ESL0684 TaxID=2983213 RepID=UPI0023F71885|nr:hypothetical protein [Lactobacillus sp. ESL0684]WEV42936.1 hypothetical protein OZX56_05150 [Lactobacillus sp. ESL0684]